MTNIVSLSKGKRIESVLYFYLIFLLGVSVGLFGPSLVGLANQTGVTLGKISTLALLLPLAFTVGVYICRYFLASYYLKPLLLISLTFFGVLLPLVGYSSSYLLVCSLFFIVVISEGIFEVASNVLLIRLYRSNPAPYLNIMHFFFGIGAIVSPILVGLNLEYYNSLTYSFIFFGALAVPAIIILLFIPIKPTVANKITVNKPRSANKFKILGVIHLFFVLYVLVEAGYSVWIFPFLSEENLLSPGQSGLFTSVFWFSFTFFRLTGVLFSIYINPIKLMICHAFLGLFALPIMISAGDQIWILWLGNVIMGAGLSVFFPCMLSYCETGFKIPAKDLSHFFVSATIGAMIGSWFVGQLLLINPILIFYPLTFSVALLPFLLLYLKKLDKYH